MEINAKIGESGFIFNGYGAMSPIHSFPHCPLSAKKVAPNF